MDPDKQFTGAQKRIASAFFPGKCIPCCESVQLAWTRAEIKVCLFPDSDAGLEEYLKQWESKEYTVGYNLNGAAKQPTIAHDVTYYFIALPFAQLDSVTQRLVQYRQQKETIGSVDVKGAAT